MEVWVFLFFTLAFAMFGCLAAPPNSMIDASPSSEVLHDSSENIRQKRHHHFGHGFGDHYGYGYGYGQFPYGYGQFPEGYGQFPYGYEQWPGPFHHWPGWEIFRAETVHSIMLKARVPNSKNLYSSCVELRPVLRNSCVRVADSEK
ncbi:unnamed protein product [Cylicocyclus nassatus]|uniref:Uncharacterized protein n=1 Tax=Cylicocyclus nassatus TaxID=53992 RepID=A0AA36H8A3_CYLNA|nr:unnamed protein product [Cylicocyclus nassatus]